MMLIFLIPIVLLICMFFYREIVKQINNHYKVILDLNHNINDEQAILHLSDSKLYQETIELLHFKIDIIKNQIGLSSVFLRE